jgi:DNA polymerase
LQDYGAGKIGWGKVYGGLLTEHVTSATARDLLTHAMYQLDQAGFDVLSTVHDEIWGESHAGRDKEFEDTMCILPHWCPDIVLKAEGDNGVRYLK